MRKLATDGTKISTPASITNVMVRSSSLADRPRPRRSAVADSGDRMRLTRSQSLADQASASSMLSRGTPCLARLVRDLSELCQPADHLAYQGVSSGSRIIAVGYPFVDLRKR